MTRRRETNPGLIKLRKIEKRLGELNYTPQAAKSLASHLSQLAYGDPKDRTLRLQAFVELSHPQFGEYKR